jgi:hypothetical protein
MSGPNVVKGDSVAKILEQALDAGDGILRLTPTWVPRSFLHPGKRIKLIPTITIPTVPTAVALMSAGSPVRLKRRMKDASGTRA